MPTTPPSASLAAPSSGGSRTEVAWHVATITARHELEVAAAVAAAGMESYIPMRHMLQTVRGKKVRMQTPAVSGLVFLRGSLDDLFRLRGESKWGHYMFLRSTVTTTGQRQYLRVRDRDMENFRRLSDRAGESLTYFQPEELRLAAGSKVRLMEGPFAGIEGTVSRLPHRRGDFLVVTLPGIAAAVSIRRQYVQPVGAPVAPSTDPEADLDLLTQLSERAILLTMTDGDSAATVADLRARIDVLRQSLKGHRTFLPNDRAHSLLAHYLAAWAVGDDRAPLRRDLTAILPRLKANNLLTPQALLWLWADTREAALLQRAEAIIARWDRLRLSPRQRHAEALMRKLKALTAAPPAATEQATPSPSADTPPKT